MLCCPHCPQHTRGSIPSLPLPLPLAPVPRPVQAAPKPRSVAPIKGQPLEMLHLLQAIFRSVPLRELLSQCTAQCCVLCLAVGTHLQPSTDVSVIHACLSRLAIDTVPIMSTMFRGQDPPIPSTTVTIAGARVCRKPPVLQNPRLHRRSRRWTPE
jgi:hypothetical protein